MPDGTGPLRGQGRDHLAVARAAIARLRNEIGGLAMVDRLGDRRVEERYRLGGVLLMLKSKRWFGGFATFTQLVERRLGMRKSTAYAAITLYKVLTRYEISWDQVRGVELSKLSLLCDRVASGRMTREDFVQRLLHAKAMSFRELAACFRLPRRPAYLLKSRPDRRKDEVITWMRAHGAEMVLSLFHDAFPSWRPQDVLAAMWRDTRVARAIPDGPETGRQAGGRDPGSASPPIPDASSRISPGESPSP